MRTFRKFLRRGKLNNQAMTLIEVMVAMAILALVVAPTLRMFATSTGTNLRAKWRQRATTVGESVMETFKAYRVSALCQMFTNGNFTGVNKDSMNNYPSMSVTAVYAGVEGPVQYTADGDLDPTVSEYHFHVEDATYEQSEYDIDITLVPRATPDVFYLVSPNKDLDAIIEMGESVTLTNGDALTPSGSSNLSAADVISYLTDLAKAEVASADNFVDDVTLSKIGREITLNVTDTAVTMQITYTCGKAVVNYHKIVSGATVAQTPVTITDTSILRYDVEFTGGVGTTYTPYSGTTAPRYVFLYFYPDYDGDIWGSDPWDKFNITCSPTDTKVLLVKQRSQLLSDAWLKTAESRYDCTVNAICPNFFHNLNEKIDPSFDDSGVPHAVTYVAGSNVGRTIEQAIKRGTPLVYDITIEVKDKDSAETLALFEGTINE